MATTSFTTPSDYSAEQRAIEQRRKLAQMLQQQGMAPMEQAPVAPGQFAVPMGGLPMAAKLAQVLSGKIQEGRADRQEQALAQRSSADLAGVMQRAQQAGMGTPAQTIQPDPQEAQQSADYGTPPVGPASIPAVPPNRQAQIDILMGRPETRPIALKLMESQIPKAPEPFTLAPGATRYGADGRPIAAAAPKPEESSLAKLVRERSSLPQGSPLLAMYDEAIKKATTQGPLVNVDNKGESEYAKIVGRQSGERDITQHDAATAAVENIAKLDMVLDHLKNSEAITGLGSEVFKTVEQAKALVMQSQKAGKRVSDTELLDSLLGSDVFPMIKALGIGARGLDTPAEREFLRNVMTGTTPLNKETLLRMTEIRKGVAERAVKKWNERVEAGELDRYFAATGLPKKKVELPKAAPKAPLVGAPGPLTPEEAKELEALRQRYRGVPSGR